MEKTIEKITQSDYVTAYGKHVYVSVNVKVQSIDLVKSLEIDILDVVNNLKKKAILRIEKFLKCPKHYPIYKWETNFGKFIGEYPVIIKMLNEVSDDEIFFEVGLDFDK